MNTDFSTQFVIASKSPITWGDLCNRVVDVKMYLVSKGLDSEDFCVTDDPTKEKELRIDIGLTSKLQIDGNICDHLRKKFGDLYFIE